MSKKRSGKTIPPSPMAEDDVPIRLSCRRHTSSTEDSSSSLPHQTTAASGNGGFCCHKDASRFWRNMGEGSQSSDAWSFDLHQNADNMPDEASVYSATSSSYGVKCAIEDVHPELAHLPRVRYHVQQTHVGRVRSLTVWTRTL